MIPWYLFVNAWTLIPVVDPADPKNPDPNPKKPLPWVQVWVLYGSGLGSAWITPGLPLMIPIQNWEFNDSYIWVLIRKNITTLQKMHTCGCLTSQKMWNNLHHIHKMMNYLIHTEKIWTICTVCLQENGNIVEHLTKLKHTWEQCSFTGHLAWIYNNTFFKQQIATSLLHSWD